MPTPVTSVSGEQQFWASINDWLSANVPALTSTPAFTYNFDQALDPAVMPQVEVSQFNYQEPGDTALGAMIFPKNPLGRIQGRFNKAVLELNIRTDGSRSPSALADLRRMRDLFVYALTNAGFFSEADNALLFPPIYLNDSLGASTNTVARVLMEEPNSIIKTFYKPESSQAQIFRYQLLFKMEWVELI